MGLIPETRGFALKRALYCWTGAKIATNARICSSAKILGNGSLIIGDNSWIGHNVTIVTTSTVVIGENVDIAPNVYIGTGTHIVDIKGNRIAGKGISKEVTIGSGTWLCAGSIVLPGSTLGKMSLVAAGSLVNGNFESYSFIAGTPAKFIKSIKN